MAVKDRLLRAYAVGDYAMELPMQYIVILRMNYFRFHSPEVSFFLGIVIEGTYAFIAWFVAGIMLLIVYASTQKLPRWTVLASWQGVATCLLRWAMAGCLHALSTELPELLNFLTMVVLTATFALGLGISGRRVTA